jgi:hypothetical protein
MQGGFYFHPSDEDLSLGTPEGKSHLAVVVSGYCNCGTAVALRNSIPGDSKRCTLNPWRLSQR